MKVWIANNWDDLRNSFWFIPTIMVAAAIALSWGAIRIDKSMDDGNWMAALGWTFSRGPEGSRAVLSTVAASMMTIASVTFSITIVALQLASSQFGPRLLRNFMGDRGNQIAIGTFIATFTYCLLVLRTVNGMESEEFVPHIAVTIGLALALVSVAVLIYFIHHSAESIQAESVIAVVAGELHQSIERLFPARSGESPPESVQEPAQALPESFDRDCQPITSEQSNYVEAIDVDSLVELAAEHGLVISLALRPGKFSMAGGPLATVWPGEKVDDDVVGKIRSKFYFGRRRTLVQDVEFAIDQLVEVAVRALSPGVNDPFTAVNCVDRLGAALCVAADRTFPSPYRYDDKSQLRVVAHGTTIPGMVEAAFNQIRQAARHDTAVTLRLLETVAAVARRTDDEEFRAALEQQARAIHRGSESGLADPMDRAEADIRFDKALRELNAEPNPS
jgi:uncharacterized membrane protein